jgi:hypothetical protein
MPEKISRTATNIEQIYLTRISPIAFGSGLPKTGNRPQHFAALRANEPLGCARTAKLSSRKHRSQSGGKPW